MTIAYTLAFGSSFLFIFLKAFQQLNVVHSAYLMVVPTSLLMAVCEVYVVVAAAHNGWGWIVLPIGLGSGLGAVCAMYLHERMRKK